MPSASLVRWQNERMPRLPQIDGQCATALAATAPSPHLTDENTADTCSRECPFSGVLPRSLH